MHVRVCCRREGGRNGSVEMPLTKWCMEYLLTQEVELEGSGRFSVVTPRVASLAVVVCGCEFVLPFRSFFACSTSFLSLLSSPRAGYSL